MFNELKEIKEQIAKEVGQHAENCPWEVCSKSEQDAAYKSADFILSYLAGKGVMIQTSHGMMMLSNLLKEGGDVK